MKKEFMKIYPAIVVPGPSGLRLSPLSMNTETEYYEIIATTKNIAPHGRLICLQFQISPLRPLSFANGWLLLDTENI